MAINFVKFQRGPQNIYDSLVAKKKIDENTLYFIYNSNAPEDGGLLYLGYTLIGGTGSNLSSISLSDLTDVSTNEAGNGSVLWYNEQLSKWEPATPAQIVNASNKLPSVTVLSSESGQTPQEVLATLVDNNENDVVIINGEPYIFDGNNWTSLTSSSLEDRVTELENQINAIDSEIDDKINAANHLTYKVEQDLNTIDTSTAQNTIFLVPSVNPATRDSYDEYMYVNGNFERLGAINEVNLSGYATEQYVNNAIQGVATQTYVNNIISNLSDTYVLKSLYNTQVGDISIFQSYASKENASISDGVKELYERLAWKDITDED